MSICRENRQPCLFPSAVKPKSSSNGAEEAVGKSCRLAAEPTIFSLIFTLKHIPVPQMSSWLNCPGVVGLLLC